MLRLKIPQKRDLEETWFEKLYLIDGQESCCKKLVEK